MDRLNLLFLLAGIYLLSACSGNLSAKVFLDSNGDNRPDGQELVLANMPTMLYRDGTAVEKLLTDADGNVNFLIWQKGKYCVRLNPTEVSQMKWENLTSANFGKALVASDPDSTPEATPNASPESSPGVEKEEPASSQPVTTTQAYEACAETKGPLNLSLDVPIPIDFSKTIASIPTPAVYPVNVGDELEIPIIFPRHCRLKEMTLPEAVGVPGAGELIHLINDWDEIVALGGKPIVDSTPLAVNRDTLREFPLKLKVTEKIFDLDPARLEITPQVSCPSGRDFDLKTHIFEAGGLSMFEIYHDREGQAIEGGEVTIVTHVINHSELNFPASDLRLIFTAPQFGDTTFDPECGSSHCSFALLPHQEKNFLTKIKIPDSLPSITHFELSATLKAQVNGYERVFQEEAPMKFGVLP